MSIVLDGELESLLVGRIPARDDALGSGVLHDQRLYPALEGEAIIQRHVGERRDRRPRADGDFLLPARIDAGGRGLDDLVTRWIGIAEVVIEAHDIDPELGFGRADLELQRIASLNAPAVEISHHVHAEPPVIVTNAFAMNRSRSVA